MLTTKRLLQQSEGALTWLPGCVSALWIVSCCWSSFRSFEFFNIRQCVFLLITCWHLALILREQCNSTIPQMCAMWRCFKHFYSLVKVFVFLIIMWETQTQTSNLQFITQLIMSHQVWQSRSSPAEAFQPRLCAQTGDIFKGFQTFQGRSPTRYQQGHLQGRPADKQWIQWQNDPFKIKTRKKQNSLSSCI